MAVAIPAGYLVVQCQDPSLASIGLGEYKGLYRTPEWSETDYERGFDDPIVFGSFTNSFGLIPDLDQAKQVLNRFAEIRSKSELDIIWTREVGCNVELPSDSISYLGVDVACRAPFWSILTEQPADGSVGAVVELLNSNGLMPDERAGRAYLSDYRREHPEKAQIDLYLWEVYALSRQP